MTRKRKTSRRNAKRGMKAVYLITYPNEKIYVGRDSTDTIDYFGSPKSALIAKNFTREDRRIFIVIKEPIWGPKITTDKKLRKKEVELIKEYQSNDPKIGYNRWPKFKKRKKK